MDFLEADMQKGFSLWVMVMSGKSQKVGGLRRQRTSQGFEMVFIKILGSLVGRNFNDAILGDPKHEVIS